MAGVLYRKVGVKAGSAIKAQDVDPLTCDYYIIMDPEFQALLSLQQRDKGPAFTALLRQKLEDDHCTEDQICLLISTTVNEEQVGLVVARQVLNELLKAIPEIKRNRDWKQNLIQHVLRILQSRLVSFEEQATGLRYQLADMYEDEEEWSDAAKCLMGISFESGNRSWSDQEKFRLYIRVTRLLLEDGDSVQAEIYYNRAALLVHSNTDRELGLIYKLSQARVHDYSRKFLEAASRYHELSWESDIEESERLQMLSAAVGCGVLAPAGPARSRILASLCRDERTAELPTHNILRKMFLDRILRPSEIKDFKSTLKPHQLARIGQSSHDLAMLKKETQFNIENGSSGKRFAPETVLDRAVMEHNLLSSSRIYKNITFSGLGDLLDLSAAGAETMARRMIEQGRLRGSIDQISRLLWFEDNSDEDDAQGKAGGLGEIEHAEDTGAVATKNWDKQIRQIASTVENIVQHISERNWLKT